MLLDHALRLSNDSKGQLPMSITGLLALFDGLRVADVRDGMDWAGLSAKGTVSPEIAPLNQGRQGDGNRPHGHAGRSQPVRASLAALRR